LYQETSNLKCQFDTSNEEIRNTVPLFSKNKKLYSLVTMKQLVSLFASQYEAIREVVADCDYLQKFIKYQVLWSLHLHLRSGFVEHSPQIEN